MLICLFVWNLSKKRLLRVTVQPHYCFHYHVSVCECVPQKKLIHSFIFLVNLVCFVLVTHESPK